MVATEEQLQRAKIPVAYRDYCSHLLIALNDCRLKEYWMPWKCEHERHSYEMCEYDEYVFFFLLARLFLYRTKLTHTLHHIYTDGRKESKQRGIKNRVIILKIIIIINCIKQKQTLFRIPTSLRLLLCSERTKLIIPFQITIQLI